MAEITRTILARVRQYVGDRRHSKRQRVRLSFSLSLSTAAQGLNGTRRMNMLDGYTSDISENGLALIVPQITLAEHHLVGENRSLNVKLQLPDGPVEVVAVPVRYERLEEDQTETGYLIGAKIVSMPDPDRERFSRFVVALQDGRS
jgi:c-di-GMP-binding flagellar brake protein YcgR